VNLLYKKFYQRNGQPSTFIEYHRKESSAIPSPGKNEGVTPFYGGRFNLNIGPFLSRRVILSVFAYLLSSFKEGYMHPDCKLTRSLSKSEYLDTKPSYYIDARTGHK
jgi:hypothetical protein